MAGPEQIRDWIEDLTRLASRKNPLTTARSHMFCAPGRDRTCDQLLRRQLLYPLSYEGICAMLSAWLSEDPVGESPRLVTGHRLNRASRESVTPRPV
jgi:hypothetical protein